jgi:hypothetical protein
VLSKTAAQVEDVVTREAFCDFEHRVGVEARRGGQRRGVFYRGTEDEERIYGMDSARVLLLDSTPRRDRDEPAHRRGAAYASYPRPLPAVFAR